MGGCLTSTCTSQCSANCYLLQLSKSHFIRSSRQNWKERFCCFKRLQALTKRRNSIMSMSISSISVMAAAANDNFRLPLSERECFIVIREWRIVHKVIVETGKTMFFTMFQNQPHIKAAFEKFRTLDTASDLKESDVMEVHGLVVMNAIDEIISNFDDKECLLELIFEQGRAHARFGDLTEEFFWAIEEPFLYAVKQALVERNTPLIEDLFRKTIRFILKALLVGFRQGIRSQKMPSKQAWVLPALPNSTLNS